MMSQAQRLGALRLPDYRRFDPKRQAQLWASLNQDEKREVLHINRDQLVVKLNDKFKKFYPDGHDSCLHRYISDMIDNYKDTLLHSVATAFVTAVEHASSVWDLSTVQCGKAEGVIFGKAVIELFEENLDGLKTAIVQFRKFIAMGELRCAWAVPLNFLHRHAVEYSLKFNFFIILAWLAASTADYVLGSPIAIFSFPPVLFNVLIGQWLPFSYSWTVHVQQWIIDHLPAFLTSIVGWYAKEIVAGHGFEFGFLIFFHYLFLRKSLFVSVSLSILEMLIAAQIWCYTLLLFAVWIVMLCISLYILYGMYHILLIKLSDVRDTWVRVDKLFMQRKIRLEHAIKPKQEHPLPKCRTHSTPSVPQKLLPNTPKRSKPIVKGSNLASEPPLEQASSVPAPVTDSMKKATPLAEEHPTTISTTTYITTTTTTTRVKEDSSLSSAEKSESTTLTTTRTAPEDTTTTVPVLTASNEQSAPKKKKHKPETAQDTDREKLEAAKSAVEAIRRQLENETRRREAKNRLKAQAEEEERKLQEQPPRKKKAKEPGEIIKDLPTVPKQKAPKPASVPALASTQKPDSKSVTAATKTKAPTPANKVEKEVTITTTTTTTTTVRKSPPTPPTTPPLLLPAKNSEFKWGAKETEQVQSSNGPKIEAAQPTQPKRKKSKHSKSKNQAPPPDSPAGSPGSILARSAESEQDSEPTTPTLSAASSAQPSPLLSSLDSESEQRLEKDIEEEQRVIATLFGGDSMSFLPELDESPVKGVPKSTSNSSSTTSASPLAFMRDFTQWRWPSMFHPEESTPTQWQPQTPNNAPRSVLQAVTPPSPIIPSKSSTDRITGQQFSFPPALSHVQNQQNLCVVCMDRNRACYLRPCGHVVTCMECTTNLKCCPLDRIPISSVEPAFL